MLRTIDQIAKEAMALPSASRADLAEKLVESLDRSSDEKIQALWVTEAKKRRDEVRTGKVKPVSGEEALARVRRLVVR